MPLPALFCGVAGGLFAFAKGTISPEVVAVSRSIDGMVMVLLGGLQTLTGPIVGASVFAVLQDTIMRQTAFWRGLLGAVILLLVLAFPRGIVGALGKLVRGAENSAMSILSVRNLSKSFGGVHAVDDVSFDRRRGRIPGDDRPERRRQVDLLQHDQRTARTGQRRNPVRGHSIVGLRPRDIWRLGVGRTFQIAATFGSMTVAENVQMALISPRTARLSASGAAWQPRITASARSNCCSRSEWPTRPTGPASVLAYGDVKRVELAIALANEPRLLLMDEPTAGMAPRERNALIALVKKLVVERGISVLFTEHSMDVVFAYADRILVLARGMLIADGTAESIRDNPEVQQVYLGTGKTYAGGRAMSEPMLEVSGLNAWYGAAHILFDLSFRIEPGEVVALMGRNGAGKSTTIKALMALIARRSGTRPLLRRGHFHARGRSRSRGAGSASCPRIAASSPT